MASDDIVQRIVIEGADQASETINKIGESIQKGFEAAGEALGPVGKALETVALGLTAVAAAAVGAGAAFFKLTEGAAETAHEMQALQTVTGGSVESISALTAALGTVGISTDEATRMLQIFSRHLADLIPTVKEDMAKAFGESAASIKEMTSYANNIVSLKAKFDDLAAGGRAVFSDFTKSSEAVKGLTASLLQSTPALAGFTSMQEALSHGGDVTNEVLKRLADIFKAMPDGPLKTAIAFQLFGRRAQEMIVFLSQGSQVIAEIEEHFKSLGLTASKVGQQNLLALLHVMNELGDEFTALKNKMGEMLAPGFLAFFQGLQHAFEQALPAILQLTQTIAANPEKWRAWGEAIGDVASRFAKFILGIIADFQNMPWDQAMQKLGQKLSDAFQVMQDVLMPFVIQIGIALGQAIVNGILEGLKGAGKTIVGNLWQDIQNNWEILKENVQRLLAKLGFGGGGGGGGATGSADLGLPMARGGPVFGPGGGDVIPALLSAGEFVFSRGAVARWGLSMLSAMNAVPRFGAGGLVGVPRFADGGPVAAGRPFVLQIEGKSFSGMTVPFNTAEALERFSVHSQLASAGRKQSWRR